MGVRVVTGAMLAALVCASSAQAAAWVTPAATIYTGAGGISSVRDSVATEDLHGDAFAAWFDVGNGNTYVSERRAGGSFPATAHLLGNDTSDEGLPQIATDAAGNVIVVWLGDGGVLHAVQQAPGGTFQPLNLPTTSGAQGIRIAAGGDGTVIVGWQDSGGGVSYSVRRRGGSFSPAASVPGSAGDQSYSFAVDRAGDIAIAVVTASGFTWSIYGGYWSHTAGGFTLQTPAIFSVSGSTDPMITLGSPRVTIDPGGDAIATWTVDCTSFSSICPGDAGGSHSVYESIRRAGSSSAFGAGVSLLNTTSSLTAPPVAAFDRSGTVVVAWGVSTGFSSDVDQRQAPLSSQSFTSASPVATGAGTFGLVMASLASGQIVIAFDKRSDSQVYGALRPSGPAGTAFGAPKQLSNFSGSQIESGSLAIGTQGNDAFVDWSLYGSGTTSPTVQGLGYSGNPPLITVAAPARARAGRSVTISAAALGSWAPASIRRINFGDGSSASRASARHTYRHPGTYTITVTATDGAGNTATATARIFVSRRHRPRHRHR